jgi:hypothetical protein
MPLLERTMQSSRCQRVVREGDELKGEWDLSDGLVGDISIRPFAFGDLEGVVQTSIFVSSRDISNLEVSLELWRCTPRHLGQSPPKGSMPFRVELDITPCAW